MPKKLELTTPRGDTLYVTVRGSDRPGPRPTVVLSHGFKGFQDWSFMPSVAELLASRGFTTVSFNFSGSGIRPGDDLVTDLEAFRRATISKDLEELTWLIASLPELQSEIIDADRIGLFGHSRGGGVSILATADKGVRDRIGAVVTWAAVSTFDRLSDAESIAWQERGEMTIVNMRTGQELAVGIEVLEDVRQNAERLRVLAAARQSPAPILLIHGDSDETVPVTEGRALAETEPTDLLELEDAGHTFGAVHPFAGPTPQLIQALNATQGWFRKYLG